MGEAEKTASRCIHGVLDEHLGPWCKTLMVPCHFPCPSFDDGVDDLGTIEEKER
jgi:hypothetical protein